VDYWYGVLFLGLERLTCKFMFSRLEIILVSFEVGPPPVLCPDLG
jgi:hypothetical protein